MHGAAMRANKDEHLQRDGVAALQQALAQVEAKFEPLRKQRKWRGDEWDALAREAAEIRRQLFALTGDAYGEPKIKKIGPSDDLLDAEYASPDEVPPGVMSWVRQHASLLTSDATDAVRWSRIVDTLNDDRYPEGDLVIYRAVDGREIRPGDWVTTIREYAEEHLERYLGGNGQVVEEIVNGRDVLVSPTGNDEEAIYAPREFSGPYRTAADREDVNEIKGLRP